MKEINEYTNVELTTEILRRLNTEPPKQQQLPKEEFPATCTICSKATTVPFKPRNGANIKCYECYKKG